MTDSAKVDAIGSLSISSRPACNPRRPRRHGSWRSCIESTSVPLFDRVADRQISAEDLYKLKLWRESEPEAPDGSWYKDFGSFKICGEGEFPKTFLLKGQPAKGEAL